jgi:AsmA family protein
VVLLNGTGGINLNTETLNLSLKGKPKQFRIFRINAPINITGSLAAPKVGLGVGGAAVQTGVAVALAAAVNPALLLLPFIDPGLNKNANCAALVAAAKADGAIVHTGHPAPAHR